MLTNHFPSPVPPWHTPEEQARQLLTIRFGLEVGEAIYRGRWELSQVLGSTWQRSDNRSVPWGLPEMEVSVSDSHRPQSQKTRPAGWLSVHNFTEIQFFVCKIREMIAVTPKGLEPMKAWSFGTWKILLPLWSRLASVSPNIT